MLLFVFTSDQAAAVQTLDPGSDYLVVPQAISASSPGTGTNANPSATGYSVGDTVTLVGNYVAPVEIINNPDYQVNAPDVVAFLQTIPYCDLATANLFAALPAL